jgi:hypothetical protein
VDGDVAREKTFTVLGEQGSDLFVQTALPAGVQVVTEGRATLSDGDRVAPKETAYEGALSSTRPDPPAPTEVKP